MPAQKSQATGLVAKLGASAEAAWNEVRQLEIEVPNSGGLPPGIEGGVAQLKRCEFRTYDKPDKPFYGEYYFMATGVIFSPEVHTYKHLVSGVMTTERVAGRQTRVLEPMCETPDKSRKTIVDHFNWLKNLFGNLGIDPKTIHFREIEQIAAFLAEQQPFFSFRTWATAREEPKQTPLGWVYGGGTYKTLDMLKKANPYYDRDPLVNEVWLSKCDPYQSNSLDPDQPEIMGIMEGSVKDKVKSTSTPIPKKSTSVPTPTPVPTPIPEDASEPDADADGAIDSSHDLDQLASLASNDQSPLCVDSQVRLTNLAIENGLDQETIENATSWQELVELMRQDGGSEDQEGGESGSEPQVGEHYFYKVLDPKTGKPMIDPKTKKVKKGVEHEILSVNPNGFVTLKNVATKQIVMDPKNPKKRLEVSKDELGTAE